MSETELNPRSVIAAEMKKSFDSFLETAHKHIPEPELDGFMSHFWAYINTSQYLATKTDEEIRRDYYRETVHKDWSGFHVWLWEQEQPTPHFKDQAKEKAFYAKLEQEYREKGLYP